MFVYWLMFLLPAWASFYRVHSTREAVLLGWGATWLTLTLLIGYRHEVGADWFNYIHHYEANYYLGFWEAVQHFDPAHGAINWLAYHMDWGVYATNLVYGAIFSMGLVAFCRAQPRPLLALAVAVPYLVVVVAMGYSRQGVAIGLGFFALLALAERNTVKFVIYVAIAALFHKSAVVLIPIAALASTERRAWTAVWVGATAVLFYFLYLQESTDSLVSAYVGARMASEGGAIRVAMNVVPALLFLANRNRFGLDRAELALWTWISLTAVAFVPILMISPSSTAVDRVALYFIPIQMYVFSRLPDALWRGKHRLAVLGAVVLYFGLVMFVWLNFGNFSKYWLPYRFYPLVDV